MSTTGYAYAIFFPNLIFSHLTFLLETLVNQSLLGNETALTGDWSEHSAKRVAFAESLSGRDRLREALKNLGFELR